MEAFKEIVDEHLSKDVQMLIFVVGLLVVAKFAVKVVLAVLSVIVPSSGPNYKKLGEYAVVTGATDGIGFAYAMALAGKGMGVVLISRDEEKLRQKKEEILAEHKDSKILTIAADFSKPNNGELYRHLEDNLKNLDIGVLVNNVGINQPHADYFSAVEPATIQSLLDVNISSATFLTRAVLPGMTSKKAGVIINVGSAAGLIPVGDPLYAVYSASKAYIDFFSRSLCNEVADKGIIVQCQVPYFVTSKLSRIRNPSFFTPDPKTYAAAALRAVSRKNPTVVPYWPHALQHFVICSVPTSLAAMGVLWHHHDIRKKALKKKAQEQK